MDNKVQLECELNAKTDKYRRLLERTTVDMQRILGRFGNISISRSTGKDSTVCLHLANTIKPTSALFIDSGAVFPESYEMIKSYQDNGYEVNTIYSNTYWELMEKEIKRGKMLSQQRRMEEIVFDVVREYNLSRKIDCQVIGLRRKESRKRDKLGQYKGSLFFARNTQSYNYYPLLQRTSLDVRTYITVNNIVYNSLYDKYHAITGKPHYEHRVDSYLEDASFELGLEILKRDHPAIYERISLSFPHLL